MRPFQMLAKIVEEETICLQAIQHTSQHWLLNNQIYDLQVRFQQAHDPVVHQQLIEWEQQPLLATIENATTLRAKLYFLQGWATCYFTKGQVQEALVCNRQFLDLLEGQPHYLYLYPEQYLSTLQNYLIDSLELGKEEALRQGLDQLQTLPKHKAFRRIRNLEARVFYQRYLLEINWLIRKKQYQAGLEILPVLEAGLDRFGDRIMTHHRYTLLYLGAYIGTMNYAYDTALHWINQLLQAKSQELLSEIFRYARLQNLLIHFGLENWKLLESLVPSTRRFLRQRSPLSEAEQSVFRFIQQNLNAVNDRQRRQIRLKMLPEWKALKQQPEEIRLFNYLDLADWLEGVS